MDLGIGAGWVGETLSEIADILAGPATRL